MRRIITTLLAIASINVSAQSQTVDTKMIKPFFETAEVEVTIKNINDNIQSYDVFVFTQSNNGDFGKPKIVGRTKAFRENEIRTIRIIVSGIKVGTVKKICSRLVQSKEQTFNSTTESCSTIYFNWDF